LFVRTFACQRPATYWRRALPAGCRSVLPFISRATVTGSVALTPLSTFRTDTPVISSYFVWLTYQRITAPTLRFWLFYAPYGCGCYYYTLRFNSPPVTFNYCCLRLPVATPAVACARRGFGLRLPLPLPLPLPARLQCASFSRTVPRRLVCCRTRTFSLLHYLHPSDAHLPTFEHYPVRFVPAGGLLAFY